VPKLKALVEAANNSDQSHFLDVPLGVAMITDALFTSPILHGDDAGGVGGMPADGSGGMVNDVAAGGLPGAGGQFAQYGGVNPELDPELANVLKESLEAERDRVR